MIDTFEYDVCISHTAHDAARGQDLAEKLKEEGLRVWRLPKPSRSSGVDGRTEDKLQATRCIALLVSSPALKSDWPWLHRVSIPFRDPTDYRRAFLPILQDDLIELPDVLRRYRILRLGEHHSSDYQALVTACRPSDSSLPGTDQARRGRQQRPLTLRNELGSHRGRIHGLAITRDGRHVISAGSDGTARYWDIETGICRSINRHANAVTPVALSPDGSRAATIGIHGVTQVWELESGEIIEELQGTDYVEAITWLSSGRLAVGTLEGSLITYDEALMVDASTRLSPSHRVRWLGSHPTVNGTLAVFENGLIALWHLGKETLDVLAELERPVLRCACDKRRGRIVYACGDQTIGVWDVSTRKPIASLEGHTETIADIAVSPDGLWAASCDSMGLRLWDLDEGLCIASFSLGVAVDSVVFSPDSTALVVGGSNGVVFVFSIADYHILKAALPATAATRYSNAKVVLVP